MVNVKSCMVVCRHSGWANNNIQVIRIAKDCCSRNRDN